jgi:co-chaperonin GroES (HSP10)
LVRVTEVEKVSKGGIALPSEHVVKEQMGCAHGHVISIGKQAWAEDPDTPWCKLGDKIVFHRYEGVTPQVEGLDDGKLRIIADIKVLGVIA